jgi:hypothetical protein
MNHEPLDVEYIQVMIPGEEYDKKLYRLVVALLESLENNEGKDQDINAQEVGQ